MPGAVKWQEHGIADAKVGMTKRGQRTDWADFFADAKAGLPMDQLAEKHPRQFATGSRGLEKYLGAVRAKDRKEVGPRDVRVLWGPTGSGKSRWAKEYLKQTYGDSVFEDVDCNNTGKLSFESYGGQKAIFIDEYAFGGLNPETLKKMCDRYPCTLPGRGTSTFWKGTCVVITAQTHPSMWFLDKKNNIILEDYKAFLRRCKSLWRCDYENWEAELCGEESKKIVNPLFRPPTFVPNLFPNPWNKGEMKPSNPAYLESMKNHDATTEDEVESQCSDSSSISDLELQPEDYSLPEDPSSQTSSCHQIRICKTDTPNVYRVLKPKARYPWIRLPEDPDSEEETYVEIKKLEHYPNYKLIPFSSNASTAISLVSDSETDTTSAQNASSAESGTTNSLLSTHQLLNRGLLPIDLCQNALQITPLPASQHSESEQELVQTGSRPSKFRRVLESDSEVDSDTELGAKSTTGQLMDSNGSPIWRESDDSEYGKSFCFFSKNVSL